MRIAMKPWNTTTTMSTTNTINTRMRQALRQGQSTSIRTTMKGFCIPIHTSRILTIGTGTKKSVPRASGNYAYNNRAHPIVHQTGAKSTSIR